MSIYLNRKTGPIALTLLDGKSYTFSPKKETVIDDSLDSSPMILRYLKKGHLHKKINLSFSQEPDIKEAIIELKKDIQTDLIEEAPLEIIDEETKDEEKEILEVKEINKRRKKLKE